MLATVFDDDLIGEYVMILIWTGIIWLIFCLNGNFNTIRNLRNHKNQGKGVIFYPIPWTIYCLLVTKLVCKTCIKQGKIDFI